MKLKPELKPDPLSRESLMIWLMLQQPEKDYAYCMPNQCMLGQWARSIDANAKHCVFDGEFTYRVNGEIVNLSHFREVAEGKHDNLDWTFGAALNRARNAR